MAVGLWQYALGAARLGRPGRRRGPLTSEPRRPGVTVNPSPSSLSSRRCRPGAALTRVTAQRWGHQRLANPSVGPLLGLEGPAHRQYAGLVAGMAGIRGRVCRAGARFVHDRDELTALCGSLGLGGFGHSPRNMVDPAIHLT